MTIDIRASSHPKLDPAIDTQLEVKFTTLATDLKPEFCRMAGESTVLCGKDYVIRALNGMRGVEVAFLRLTRMVGGGSVNDTDEVGELKERLRTAESLLSELLKLDLHLEKQCAGFLTASHEGRIREFLGILKRVHPIPGHHDES